MLTAIRDGAAPALAWVWLGVVVGVAFIAIPSHFMVEGLALPQALSVNRLTFALLNRAEIGLAVALAVLLAWRGGGRWAWGGACLAAAIVALQGLWLVPVLAARTDIYLAGGTPPPSPVHSIAVTLEGLKLLALAATAVSASRRNRSAASR